MFNSLNLKQKIILVIALSSSLVIIFASCLWGYYDRINLRREMVDDLTLTTNELNYGLRKIVSTKNKHQITKTLGSLKDNPGVISAWVLTPKGKIIAGYMNITEFTKRNPQFFNRDFIVEQIKAVNSEKLSSKFFDNSLIIKQTIRYNDETVGYIYVLANLVRLEHRMSYHIQIVLLVTIISILFSVILAFKMHSAISKPILSLASVMDKVSRNKDYSVRIKIASQNDEITELMKVFNEMISEIESQNLLQKENEAAIRKLAYFDTLTQMPNRRLFHEYLDLVLKQSDKEKTITALMFIDLDKFKHINDTLGHDMGDVYLVTISDRLKASIKENQISDDELDQQAITDNIDKPLASRLGGDEFTIIIPNTTKEKVKALANKIVENCRQIIMLGDEEFDPSLSIGISMYPFDADNEDELLKSADLAMYQSKQKRAMVFTFFEDLCKGDPTLEDQIREALKNKDFYLHYQPIYDIRTNKIIGAEALFRWKHPEQGVIYPDDFLYKCEEMNIMMELGEITIKDACEKLRIINEAGFNDFIISINTSNSQFSDSKFFGLLEKYINLNKINPSQLILEVVESVLLTDINLVKKTIKSIKEFGIQLAIDDFGTGYSSLRYLALLPFDYLKIDYQFTSIMLENQNCQHVTDTILSLANKLDLKVIAEGIEYKEQLSYYLENNCNLCQGFYFDKAMPFDELLEKLNKKQN